MSWAEVFRRLLYKHVRFSGIHLSMTNLHNPDRQLFGPESNIQSDIYLAAIDIDLGQ